MGVLIDDLTSNGVSEPYRMFTSRAEFRLSLRADNADLRLTELGASYGLIGPARLSRFRMMVDLLTHARELSRSLTLTPDAASKHGLSLNRDGIRRSAYELLAHPGMSLARLAKIWPELGSFSPKITELLEIEAQYAVYLERQGASAVLLRKDEERIIPELMDFSALSGLSNELKQKLKARQPRSIAAAQKIDGMTPAAIALILLALRRHSDTKVLADVEIRGAA